jgi:NIPSNAP
VIHEYRTYTIAPGQLETYLALAESKVIPIRSDRYGRLVAFWTSEFGTMNQVHHIWEYASLDQRQQLRRDLSQNKAWCAEFLAGAWPTMQSQEIRFMLPQTPLGDTHVPAGFYERRIYRCPAGLFAQLGAAVVTRPRSAEASLFGVWISESPQPNEIVEIVAYPSWQSRLDDRPTATAQRLWCSQNAALLQQVESVLLLPIGISPVK